MVLLTDSWKIDAIALLFVVIALLYYFVNRTYTYWERKGFKCVPNYNYLVGHFEPALRVKEFAGDFITKLYKSTNDPFIGIYSILRPILLVRDPELIRSVLIKDFQYFTERNVHCNENYDPLSATLFALPSQKWKNLRGKLSPAFTSGKLKAMFSTLLDCGSNLQSHLDKLATKRELVDVRELAACHTTNVIASVGFGIDVDTISDPKNEFRVYGRQIFEPSLWNAFRWFFFFYAPEFMPLIRMKIVNASVEKFIKSVVKENLEYREKNNVTRKDFFQLLIQLRNTGTVQLDDQWETVIKGDENQKTMTINELYAQTFVFFAAGFETSSTTLSFCLYELAKNSEIQKRVHDEIDRTLKEHNGKITYDSISDMKYLESCIDETLRLYPTLPILSRTCVKDYKIPGTNKVIEKGVEIYIPAFSLQRDEKYYANPKKFDPERFNEENSAGKNIVNRPYIPFGDGPRNCIGMRLGKLQTKVGLVMTLQNFRYELGDQHKGKEIELDPKNFLISPLGGIHLNIFKR